MQPYQERVIEEKKALDEKIDKLRTFISDDPKFADAGMEEQGRLREQLQHMLRYTDVLHERIAAFIPGDGVAGDRQLEGQENPAPTA